MRHTFWLSILYLLFGCDATNSESASSSIWRGVLDIGQGRELPFSFTWNMASDTPMVIRNADERIVLRQEDIKTKGDSLWIYMPVFESCFLVKHHGDSWTGVYQDLSRGMEYEIPFRAERGFRRFDAGEPGKTGLASTWAVRFSPDMEGEYPAIARLEEQADGTLIGTFLTETGDYRFLEGYWSGDQLALSAFDGSHAFLFTATIRGDSLQGMFYSGNHHEEPWTAVADPEATLGDAAGLTQLQPGYDGVSFAFPNLRGDTVRYPAAEYEGKVVIIQLLGSWCPNCMDETRLFAEWYGRYHSQGLEVIGLAFERRDNLQDAAAAVSRMADRLDADYEMLIASLTTSKDTATEQLPMLSAVLSYPTSIWVDRSGEIRRIHTGFNGPGTGELYEQFVEEYEGLIEEMLEG